MAKLIDHCDFTLLGLKVTNDLKKINSAYDKTRQNHKTLENHTDPLRRAYYKRIIAAGANLRDDNKRKEAIKTHVDSASNFIPFMLEPVLKNAQTQVSTDYYNGIIAMLTDPAGAYHLDEQLAKDTIGKVLTDYSIQVGGQFTPKPPADPKLPDKVTVVPYSKGLHLSWMFPNKDCDRVVICRSYTNYPKDKESDSQIFKGRGNEHPDDTVEPGKIVYYSFFSEFGSRVSTAKVTRESFYAPDVENFKINEHFGKNVLSWDEPKIKPKQIIIFRSEPNKPIEIVYSNGLPYHNRKTQRIMPDKHNSYEDCSIEPGAIYEYKIFTEYETSSQQFYSPGILLTANSVPTASPVKEFKITSVSNGLSLSWILPATFCDQVKIIRRQDHLPKNEHDGNTIYEGTASPFVDKEDLNAGETYYYAVYSIFRSYASSCVTGYLIFAGEIEFFQASNNLEDCIELRWILPSHFDKVHIFKRINSVPDVKVVDCAIVKDPEDIELTLPNSNPPFIDRDVHPSASYHYLIIVRYQDGQYSPAVTTKGSALESARPVKNLKASVDNSGCVHLTWEHPEVGKDYLFWVTSKDVSSAAVRTFDPCKMLSFDDKDAEAGKEYEYSVFSRLDKVTVKAPPKVTVLVTKEVEPHKVIARSNEVYVEWSLPENVKAIKINRDGSFLTRLEPPVARFSDKGVVNDKTYSYTVFLVFQDSSKKEHRSKGLNFKATPVIPPKPAEQINGFYDGHKVVLKWSISDSTTHKVYICRSKLQPSLSSNSELNIHDIKDILAIISVTSTTDCYEDSGTVSGDIYYYAFYTVKHDLAVYSGFVKVAVLEPVKNLKAFNRNGDVYLQWDWPLRPDIAYVTLYRNNVKIMNMTYQQYNMNGSMFLDKVDKSPKLYSYTIDTCYRIKSTIYNAWCSVNIDVTGGCLPKIQYFLKVKKGTVEVSCRIPKCISNFGGLVLLKKTDSEPKDRSDGVTVCQYRSLFNNNKYGNSIVSKLLNLLNQFLKSDYEEITLNDDLSPNESNDTYYKLFLLNESDEHKIKIEHPPITDIKVSVSVKKLRRH